MNNDYKTTAIVFDEMKSAALFFDHLIPVMLMAEYTEEMDRAAQTGKRMTVFRAGVSEELCPPNLKSFPNFNAEMIKINNAISHLYALFKSRDFAIKFNSNKLFTPAKKINIGKQKAIKAFTEFLITFGLQNCPIASTEGIVQRTIFDKKKIADSPVVNLSNIKLIDTYNASWLQIKEFRKDREAVRKLRRFRLFAFENYSNRSKAFVEDDLLTRLYDYEQSIKEWGFETLSGSFNSILNSRLTSTVVGGSLISALFGNTAEGLVAISAGTTLAIGNVALEFTKKYLSLKKIARENPISYISYARKKTEDKG